VKSGAGNGIEVQVQERRRRQSSRIVQPLFTRGRIIPLELTLDFLNQRKKGIKES